MSIITEVNQLWSVIGVGQTLRQLIQQAMSGASLDAMARSILSSGVIETLEKTAETLFPNVAPELKLAAAVVAGYDHDGTKWLQQSMRTILGIDLAVDGIYGPATTAAVEEFQQQTLGLKVDGFAYRVTRPLIEAALAKLLAKSSRVAAIVGQQEAVTAPAQVAS